MLQHYWGVKIRFKYPKYPLILDTVGSLSSGSCHSKMTSSEKTKAVPSVKEFERILPSYKTGSRVRVSSVQGSGKSILILFSLNFFFIFFQINNKEDGSKQDKKLKIWALILAVRNWLKSDQSQQSFEVIYNIGFLHSINSVIMPNYIIINQQR